MLVTVNWTERLTNSPWCAAASVDEVHQSGVK